MSRTEPMRPITAMHTAVLQEVFGLGRAAGLIEIAEVVPAAEEASSTSSGEVLVHKAASVTVRPTAQKCLTVAKSSFV